MDKDFSVLMSLYIKEKPEYLIECLESLENQTVKPKEWVIVEDGPLTKELYDIIDEYKIKYPNLIKTVKLEVNVGLGEALRNGVIACSYPLIARMDTDDIAVSNRFELQLNEFDNDINLDICGSYIYEFIDNIENIVSERKVPLNDNDIKKYQKRRDGFNHMSVMFKKESVINSGNYQSCLLMEDTLLWVNMFKHGCKCKNIEQYLVYARVGKDMYSRRGGFSYFKNYRNAKKIILKTGYISYCDYFITIFVQFAVCMVPNKIREIIFKKILRR